MAVTVTQTT